jgi:Xaa-Pro aminopeptidase
MADPTVHARRRARFFDHLKEGVALLFAAPEASFGHDVAYRYRPDPDFLYLTGFPEPGATAVLDADARTFTLFVLPRDRERETWEGRRAGPEGAVKTFGADRAWPAAEREARLPGLVRKSRVLHHAFGISDANDRLVAGLLARFRREARSPKRGPVTVSDPTDLLHAMRLVKSPEEIALMERAAAVAASAHRDARRVARPGRWEYEVEAAVDRRFRTMGASGPAYPTIVASGENATILHYVENSRRIGPSDLVLVDAGCEVSGYASDVTRTFPASGRFSRPQGRLYAAVLAAQRAAIAAVKPGAPWDAPHEAAREVLLDALLAHGLLKGSRETLRKKNAAQRFALHHTSHWLGLDVHDRGRYRDENGRPRLLEPGMVLTIEPGLYVRPDETRVPKEYLGIGVRIEDDVLVTGSGARVLTEAAPKDA